MVGNFPQAFSHVGLILTAMNLSDDPYQPGRASLPADRSSLINRRASGVNADAGNNAGMT